MSIRGGRDGGGRLRILVLSWRDPKNPKAGGAELFTHEVARRLVAGGDTVEWFVAGFPGSAAEEMLDGVRIVRAGRQWTVHAAAYRRYRRRMAGRYDVVIDEVNTIPFFTPLWAGLPSLLLIYQLAREVWWYESPFPLSAAGYAFEPLYLRAYRGTPAMTISSSTRSDLAQLGFTAPITVLPIGIEPMTVPNVPKESATTLLYVGRLAPSKRVHDIIDAFALYRKTDATARLWLVGEGSAKYKRALLERARGHGVDGAVEQLGRLSSDDKHERMARAHVLLMASVREGWGLSIAEANACGTPAVVYDVPGLKDAVRSGETGLVVRPRVDALANGIAELLANPQRYAAMAAAATTLSAGFSFDATARSFREAVLASIGQWTRGRSEAP